MAQTVKKEGILFYLFLLTGFFALLEISFFIQCNKTYLSDFTFVSDKLDIPLSILPGIIFFISVQCLIHIGYCVGIGFIMSLISGFLNLTSNQTIRLGIGVWFIGLLTILVANQYYFPNSKFSALTTTLFFNQTIAKVSLIFLSFICAVFVLLALAGLVKMFFSLRSRTKMLFYFLILFGFVVISNLIFSKPSPNLQLDAATKDRPNIILVGVDSLRPDFLSFFGHKNATPFFDAFLNQASVFSDAVTPLARTFPSWTSILTGDYPKQNGVRYNLAEQSRAKLSHTLPVILKKNGYETWYATDETRFSNIDKNFGFDRVMTPPMGLNDFLVGTFNDFPMSNLLVNTWIGQWLFPYSYGNRPVFFTYDPNSFLNLIRPALKEPRTKPLFLTVHFCLTHHPYLWSSIPANDFSVWERYEASIVKVDQQINDFFSLLKQYQLLDHAIVVLLSDHGEALEFSGDRITEQELFVSDPHKKTAIPKFYPPSLDDEKVNQSAGHGTDVLGLTQYHTLLAFKLYGMGSQDNRVIPGVVSVLDIKPTLLSLIGLNDSSLLTPASPFAGQSLASMMTGKQMALPRRHVFLESDFTPEAIRTVYPETRKVLLEGIEIFQIEPTTNRLTVKDHMGEMIIKSKQYADIYGEWILALYPQGKDSRMPILVNLSSGKWTNDLQSPFAQQSPASEMLKTLKAFYGNEINNIH